MPGGTAGARFKASGAVVVCCVHGRAKRKVADLTFDRSKEKVQLCPCCENLFTTVDDTPRQCDSCGGFPIHLPAGPIPEPKGVIS